jgi:hypothetical protein
VEETVLFWLTHKVPGVPLSVVQRLCPGRDPERTARRKLRALELEGLVELEPVIVPAIADVSPIVSHYPEAPREHDWHAVSHLLEAREKEKVPDIVATATDKARSLFGGRLSGRLRSVDVAHAVRTAHVFASLKEDQACWRPEAELLARGLWHDEENIPDAALLCRGRVIVLEIGGKYPAAKLIKRATAWARFPFRLY